MSIREMWARVTTTRYARVLEFEAERLRGDVERLRAENRALLNSILGIAGVPPIPATVADLASVNGEAQSKYSGQFATADQAQLPGRVSAGRSSSVRGSAVRSSPRSQIAVPMRKRSWQQINRMLEFESAQREKPGADQSANGHG